MPPFARQLWLGIGDSLAGDQEWMSKAFLVVEAALAMELATPSRVCMTEDYLRSSLIRGLSYSEPSRTSRVTAELTRRPDWGSLLNNPVHGGQGQGRPIQHDAVQTRR